MNAKVITIANHKGGVGKTTSTASIGAGLAILGKHVLLIDLDAQQNLSFTQTKNEDPETSVYDSLVKDMPLPIARWTAINAMRKIGWRVMSLLSMNVL